MPSLTGRGTGKVYWRSLDELAEAPEFRALVDREFPYLEGSSGNGSSRRGFLKLMGASVALAGLTGCRWPKEKIVEYARRPPGRVPGTPVNFATVRTINGVATGLLVTSYDGRPIKIEGNPLHPMSLGATDSQMQAAILEIYDPDRSLLPRHGKPASANPPTSVEAWTACETALHDLAASIKSTGGKGVCILSEPSGSPTFDAVRARLQSIAKDLAWFEYSPVPLDSEAAGTTLAFGSAHVPQMNFSEAASIVSFDCDFLLTHPASLRYMRDFAKSRTAASGKMSRLHVVETNLSLTGSNADHRYAERFADVPIRLAQLAAELVHAGLTLPEPANAAAAKLSSIGAKPPKYLGEIAKDLLASKGRSIVCVGYRLPPEAHALAALLNAALENHGKTVSYVKVSAPQASKSGALGTLVERMNAGQVNTLVILGGNPVYDAPSDLEFAKALTKVASSMHLSLYEDETSRECAWHIPAAHWLESWGDGRAWDGTISIQQPLILPLYGGKSAIELVAAIASENAEGYALVQRTFREKFAPTDFETAWQNALHDGVVPNSKAALESPAIVGNWDGVVAALAKLVNPAATGQNSFEISFEADRKLFDGRFANNGWLQELPDPITKMTWDNAAYISPIDAARLGIRRDDRIEISLGGKTLNIPVCTVPGHATGAITLPIGWGRDHAGVVAKGCGFDVNALRTRANFHSAQGATVRATGSAYLLATTQDHHAITTDVGTKELKTRIPELVREGTLTTFVADSKFAQKIGHKIPLVQLFDPHAFPDRPRWAMTIDLTKCTGCSACVVACQAENNIPVVGKEEVRLGREMHWIRIDRYFNGDPMTGEIEVVHQPLPCQQCENAPCEQVCPVAATLHDEQGLNVMVYNRCIGTRYCSNNCPYKVRRFNWFYNQHGPRHPRSKVGGVTLFQTFDIKNNSSMLPQTKLTDVEKMGKNPDVTVRSRGVMEKCTFCVQRLTRAKIEARNDAINPTLGPAGSGRPADNPLRTACAQACPAEAITFGDLNLADARVIGQFHHDRSYALLEEINVRPRVRYLAKLRNPGGEHAEHGHEAPHA
jgi:MoCo/4Fe-4S cofactor protein with predicted Tat translocation signal